MKEQSGKFLPGLVFAQELNGNISFLNNLNPDAVAQVQLAMRGLGRALLSKSVQPEEAIRQVQLSKVALGDGDWLVAQAAGRTRLSPETLKKAMSSYHSVPRDSVWLVVNQFVNQSTGISTRWLPQDATILIAATTEAQRVAALVLAEAIEQEKRHKAMLAAFQARQEVRLELSQLDNGILRRHAGRYDNVARENRVVIEWENGKREGFWLDQLTGYTDGITDVKSWLAHKWVPPLTAVRWQLIAQPESSKRETSGWVVQSHRTRHDTIHAGELFDPMDPVAIDRAMAGEVHRHLGEFVLFAVRRSAKDGFVGRSIYALRETQTKEWRPIEIDERDAVVSHQKGRAVSVIFAGDQSSFYALKPVEAIPVGPARPSFEQDAIRDSRSAPAIEPGS